MHIPPKYNGAEPESILRNAEKLPLGHKFPTQDPVCVDSGDFYLRILPENRGKILQSDLSFRQHLDSGRFVTHEGGEGGAGRGARGTSKALLAGNPRFLAVAGVPQAGAEIVIGWWERLTMAIIWISFSCRPGDQEWGTCSRRVLIGLGLGLSAAFWPVVSEFYHVIGPLKIRCRTELTRFVLAA